nr:uncharacterized mitochondrial protein AtMg00810-like [Tanacetum cinerariifolium]
CPSCEQGKSKRASHPPKPVPNSRQRLHLLHMNLCGPMRIASINGKRITVLLQSPVIIIRTDNGTEFKNQALNEYFNTVGISHQMSSVRTPQQNGVVERQNRTLANATEKHLKEVKRIFRYLRGTINTGLWYTKDSGFELTGFSDADYAGCKDTFKSTFGGAQFLGEKLVSWSSKKQDCTALSTVEAEYVSLSACCA